MDEKVLSPELYFRRLRLEDMNSMKALCQECFPLEYEDRWYQRLLTGREDAVFALGAFSPELADDFMIGVIVGEAQRLDRLESEYGVVLDEAARNTTIMYITIFGVTASFRRRGIGCQLMDYLKEYVLRETNHQLIYLHVESTNDPAILFYKKTGFKFFYRDIGYYHIENNPADGLVYILYTNGGKEYSGTVRSWFRRHISDSMPVVYVVEFCTFIKELFVNH